MEVVEESTTIAVNIIDIDIKEVSVEYDGSSYSPTDSKYFFPPPCFWCDGGDANWFTDSHDEETQTITWTFAKTIPAGTQAKLTIKFQGSLNDNMAGELVRWLIFRY